MNHHQFLTSCCCVLFTPLRTCFPLRWLNNLIYTFSYPQCETIHQCIQSLPWEFNFIQNFWGYSSDPSITLWIEDCWLSRFHFSFIRQNPLTSLLIFGSLFIVILNESVVYYLKRWQWRTLQCSSDECTRILLVADPQILGETFDTNFYNGLAVHDCDRFLR